MLPFARLPVLTISALALAVSPVVATAQAPVGAIVTFVLPAGDFGSKNFTDLLVNTLAATRQFCGQLDKAYQVDCLAERIGNMANSIPQDTDYDEIRAVLDSTADEMAALVRSNRDSNKPRERVSAGGTVPQATTRPLSPVRESDLASVNQRAAAILEQTQTMLLRTPEDGTGKNAHYTRIADALGSNKTLLRSA